jgi:hypothetical protein
VRSLLFCQPFDLIIDRRTRSMGLGVSIVFKSAIALASGLFLLKLCIKTEMVGDGADEKLWVFPKNYCRA